jgi:hypothetical protein
MKVFFTGVLFLNSLLNGFAAIARVANSSRLLWEGES